MGIQFYPVRSIKCSRRSIVQAGRILPILILFITGSLSGFSQTTTLTLSSLSGDFPAPDRGSEQWNGSPWDNSNDPYIPAGNSVPMNIYRRFLWAADLEDATQGVYNWAVFDGAINSAIDKGQIFSFGLMPMCTGCINRAWTYPNYLHNLMQAEASNSQDWQTGGTWIPNWNSPNYLARWAALCNAVAAHIQSGSHNGVNYRDVIGYVDIRGYGETGEWNTWPWYNSEPTGRKATSASLNSIVDAVANAFPNNQLVICFGALDPGNASITPPATSAYILAKSNNFGRIGWRRDNLGNAGFDGALDGQPGILTQWQYAPIGGEPNNDMNDAPYGDLPREVTKYHMSYFGNGNWSSVNASNATFVANARQASANAGYYLRPTGGSMTTSLTANGPFNITLNWQNVGVAPLYRTWNVTYELRNGATVVWTGNSAFNTKLFLPQGTPTPASDNFTLTSVAAGTYSLYLIVKDPVNYRKPLPLAISGRNADGSYLLRSNITVGTGGPVNQPPVANAGSDLTIQLPTSSVSLTGTGTDADGSVASYAWTKASGPAAGTIATPTTANTSITGLVQGVYVFTLTVKDNLGATSTDNIQVTVNAAPVNQPPVANAGSDLTIQLPTSTVSLTGTGSDADGSIASYAWTKASGPAAGTIVSPATASSSVTGLVQGVYVFTCTVKDNLGATATDNIQVTVNAAAPVNQPPVASAGNDLTIQLPASTVSVTGTGTDADGSVASYAWTQASGPAGSTIVSSTTASTSITGLVQGTYVFTLTVTDNLGAAATDNIQVTVNAAAPVNQPPVASAGNDLTIQLPTSTVSVTGTGTDVDGSISSYAWTKTSGPAGSTIASPATANTGITGLVQGVYVFTLTVKDNLGATATDNIQVTVNAAAPVNQPPVAKAGTDMSITMPTNAANVNGSSSSDPDGTISSYQWTKVSGPAQYAIGNGSAMATTVNNLTTGVYAFQLKVTDNAGASSTDTVNVTVNALPPPPNQPPVAIAGTDQTITLPTNSVTINGGTSSDPDGSISAYLWAKLSGPAQFTMGNNTAASTIVNNLTAGVYTFQLRVTDNLGAIALDTVKIIVNSAPVNQLPVANAGADISIILPTNITNLNGSASSDADGTISAYTWSQVSGPGTATITAASSAATGVSGLVQGSYVFSLKVTDNSGAADLDSITVIVNAAPNSAPIANAGKSKSITHPNKKATLDGTLSTDPDGTISAYSWTEVSGPTTAVMTGANSPVAAADSLEVGVYNFQLAVTDNNGATSTSTVKITVTAASIPVANAGADQTIALPTNSVIIDGSGSVAPSGSIVSYAWTEKSGPSTIGLANTVQNTLNNLQAGVYVFYLVVTDNNAATASDSVTITVIPAANQAPVANAGIGVNLTLPANSTSLSGGASYDPDGTISAYSWKIISGPNAPTTTGANTANLNLSGLIAGTYDYQLTVTDNSGTSSSAQVKIIVTAAPNVPPVANAGPNQSITAPASSVILNGSASMDADGTIASYSWVTVSGPGSITINNSNTVTPSVIGLVTGGYVFELTVTDNNGASSKDQISVTVLPASILPNQPPVANAGNSNFTITLPVNSVDLNGSNSFDPDGTITSYSWRNTSGPSVPSMSGANTVSPTASQLVVGTYVFELTVTDNNGATNIDYVNVTVNPYVPKANQAPVADAGTNQSITAPASSVVLNGSASSDPDGTIVAYSWVTISGPGSITINNSNTATPSVIGLETGIYVLELTVTDNSGATAKDQVNVTVLPESVIANQIPVANAGSDNITIILPTNSITLDGSNSYDPDGTIVSYSWKNTSGPSVANISGNNTVSPTISQLVEGTYSFELTVTDNSGASTIDYVNVVVTPGHGWSNTSSTDRLTVYPNPANSVVNQRITSPITGTVKVNIYDMSGKLVLARQFEKTSDVVYNKIVVDQLAPGMYTIQVNIANRTTMVSKFIKN